jgi:hypothetical protein
MTQKNKPKKNKISETFLRFAAPILSNMPNEATPEEIRKALVLPHTIWNAIVFDHANGTRETLTQIRQALANDPVGLEIVEILVELKQTLFRDDLRLIGNYQVTKLENGDINVWAEARDPFSSIMTKIKSGE